MAKMNKKQKELFSTIEAAGPDGTFVERSEELKALTDVFGVVDFRELEDGRIQARVKPEVKPNGADVDGSGVSVESGFEIESDVPLSPAQRGGRKVEKYPFSQLEIGQSFVVPAGPVGSKTEKPWETFASTVSSATRRYSKKSGETRINKKGVHVPVLVPTRKFTLRRINAGDKYPNGKVETQTGARVFRIA